MLDTCAVPLKKIESYYENIWSHLGSWDQNSLLFLCRWSSSRICRVSGRMSCSRYTKARRNDIHSLVSRRSSIPQVFCVSDWMIFWDPTFQVLVRMGERWPGNSSMKSWESLNWYTSGNSYSAVLPEQHGWSMSYFLKNSIGIITGVITSDTEIVGTSSPSKKKEYRWYFSIFMRPCSDQSNELDVHADFGHMAT